MKMQTSGVIKKKCINRIAPRALCFLLFVLAGCTTPEEQAAWTTTDQPALAVFAVDSKSSFARLVAAGKLTDRALLAKIATEDKDWQVRQAAVKNKNFTDKALLAKIAGEDKEWFVRDAAAEKLASLSDILANIGRTVVGSDSPFEMVAKTTDQALLAKIAMENKTCAVRLAAVGKLTDQTTLAKIAMGDADRDVRRVAVAKITDQAALAKIAMDDEDGFVSKAAFDKLTTNQALLDKIVATAKNSGVRKAAIDKRSYQSQLADWQSARSVGTISAYKEFIQKHPNAKQSPKAKTELSRMEADRDWESAQKANSIPAYEAFLTNYPTSQYASEAKKRLPLLVAEKAWTTAEIADTDSAWIDFIMNYPDSPKCETATAKLKNHQVLRTGELIPWAAFGGKVLVKNEGVGGTVRNATSIRLPGKPTTFLCNDESEFEYPGWVRFGTIRCKGHLKASADGLGIVSGMALIPVTK